MNPVRLVTLDDIPTIAEWALPRFRERHPRMGLEALMPMLKGAVDYPEFAHLVCTDNAVGMFAIEHTPWEPEPVVCDVFVTGRDASSAFEVSRVYQAGEQWARQVGAVEYRYGTDTDTDLSAIARRVGYDAMARNYVKKLR